MKVGIELECLPFLFWKAICMIYNSEYYFENYHKLDKTLTKTEMEKPFEKDRSVINTEHHDGILFLQTTAFYLLVPFPFSSISFPISAIEKLHYDYRILSENLDGKPKRVLNVRRKPG